LFRNFGIPHCGKIFLIGIRATAFSKISPVKFTQYFLATRERPDRALIQLEWIQRVINHPAKELIQQDGRICRWAAIMEMQNRWLRVILLPDGETVHNAFFDRTFRP
jgi:hypothetical protein